MKKTINTAVISAAAFILVSCISSMPVSIKRSGEKLASYTDSRLVPVFVTEPVAAVIAAIDTDIYLSSGSEMDESALSSLFPSGILHIDDRTIRIIDIATVYADGNSINTPGAVWKVDRSYQTMMKYPYEYYGGDYFGDMEWTVKCTAADTWELLPDSDYCCMESSGIHVRFLSEAADAEYYLVTSSGSLSEYDYTSVCSTDSEGVTVKYSFSDTYSARILKPASGTFNADFHHGNDMLDYCTLAYSENGFFCSSSAD